MISSQQPERRRPPALQSGDTVGIVAPASGFRRADFDAGCDRLRQLGYRPYYSPSIFERDLYFAGSIERRVHELHEMFSRSEVRAILCARGGYGCNYLLPHLDLELIRANPKIFAGCSDVTTLLTYLSITLGWLPFMRPWSPEIFLDPTASTWMHGWRRSPRERPIPECSALTRLSLW